MPAYPEHNFTTAVTSSRVMMSSAASVAIGIFSVSMYFAASAHAIPPAQEVATISGHVYRIDTHEPIAQALVTLEASTTKDSKDYQQAKTDSQGAYSFAGLRPGEYGVRAEHSGFLASSYNDVDPDGPSKTITLKPGQIVNQIDFLLRPDATISGTVVDEDNEPVRGMTVIAMTPIFMAGLEMPSIRFASSFSVTDDLGRYRLSRIRDGYYFVRVGGFHDQEASVEGRAIRGVKCGITYFPRAKSFDLAKPVQASRGVEVTDINIVISGQTKAFAIGGTVANPDTKPDVPAEVQIFRLGVGPGDFIGPIGVSTVKKDGSFLVVGVPPGVYVVAATQRKEAGGPVNSSAAFGETVVQVKDTDLRIDLVMMRTGNLRGTLEWEKGIQHEASDNLFVRLAMVDPAPLNLMRQPYAHFLKVDEKGSFEGKGIRPGNYRIFMSTSSRDKFYAKHVQCNGRDYATEPIPVQPGKTVGGCEIVLAKATGSIRGRVLMPEKSIGIYSVIAIPRSKSLRHYEPYMQGLTSTDDSGEFQIEGLIPGDYLVFAVPPDPLMRYFAIDFADRNANGGMQVTVNLDEPRTIVLKPIEDPQ